jgi:hypothetical protein
MNVFKFPSAIWGLSSIVQKARVAAAAQVEIRPIAAIFKKNVSTMKKNRHPLKNLRAMVLAMNESIRMDGCTDFERIRHGFFMF